MFKLLLPGSYPKVEGTINIKDFKHINLVGCVYKLIAKECQLGEWRK